MDTTRTLVVLRARRVCIRVVLLLSIASTVILCIYVIIVRVLYTIHTLEYSPI